MSRRTIERPAFQAVEIGEQIAVECDVKLDKRLDQTARAKGIPTLVEPASDGGQDMPAAAPRRPIKTLNVELPDYLWIELKTRAAKRMISVRHLIMTLLRDNGYEIYDDDMIEDGRRLRGSRARPE